ncbi:MAG: hypothetical protein K2X35_01310 [Bryobacteraceae bacterium]|nr:hypothetical protein [Bryobacteraceae bacterium]
MNPELTNSILYPLAGVLAGLIAAVLFARDRLSSQAVSDVLYPFLLAGLAGGALAFGLANLFVSPDAAGPLWRAIAANGVWTAVGLAFLFSLGFAVAPMRRRRG